MTFTLKLGEPVAEGVRRNASREIRKALDHLSGPDDVEAVHETRKCFKKVRAALRLVREDLGEDAYHEENWAFRDAARPLTQVRDAQMLVETFDKLGPATPSAAIRDMLRANEKEVTERVLHTGQALVVVKKFAVEALARRVPSWTIDRDGWAAVASGVRRVYRTGHHALARAIELPTVENLHELRKQTKYVWHVLQLLEPAWSPHDEGLAERAHDLSRELGDDHDLAVVRSTLAADPRAYGGHAALKALFSLIDSHRAELQQRAFVLAKQIYADPPQVFASRLEGYWRAASTSGSSGADVDRRTDRRSLKAS